MKKTRKEYGVFGIEIPSPDSYAMIGTIWLIVIIFFPIWIWFYLIYKILWYLGKSLNHVKVKEVEEEEKTYY